MEKLKPFKSDKLEKIEDKKNNEIEIKEIEDFEESEENEIVVDINVDEKPAEMVVDMDVKTIDNIEENKEEIKEENKEIEIVEEKEEELADEEVEELSNDGNDENLKIQREEQIKRAKEFRKLRPSKSVLFSPTKNPMQGAIGVDDVFYGWLKKKGRIRTKKTFMILRLPSLTISLYSDKNFNSPRTIIHVKLVKIVKGWIKPIKLSSDETTPENAAAAEEDEILPHQFTIMTPFKHYYFKADVPDQPTMEQWISRIENINTHYLESNTLLSSKRYLSTIPERFAVIPTNEKLLFFRSPKLKNLHSRGKIIGKKLTSKFPRRRFIVISDYDNTANKRKTGTIRPKHFLGTLNVFETLNAVDSGVVIHHIPNDTFHTYEAIFSDEVLHYILRAMNFYDRLDFLKLLMYGNSTITFTNEERIRLENPVISSFISDFISEFAAFRKSATSISDKNMDYHLFLLNNFVGYDWSNPDFKKDTFVQPSLEGAVQPDSRMELILIQFIGILKCTVAVCSGISNIWSNNGSVMKLVKQKISFLISRITRCHTKEEKKAFKDKVRDAKRARKESFTKAKSSKKVNFFILFLFSKYLYFSL